MTANGPFTLDDLREIMRVCAGEPEGVSFDDDIADIPFAELGLDSLAVMEVAAKVENHLGVVIPEEEAEGLLTPRTFAEYVNARLAAA